MKMHEILLLLLLAGCCCAGEKLFSLEITPENLTLWDRYKNKGLASIESVEGEKQLVLREKCGPLWVPLDTIKPEGRKLRLLMSCQYKDVPGDPKKNMGFRVLYCGGIEGKPFYIQLGPVTGTSDWEYIEGIIPPMQGEITGFRLEISSPGGEVAIDEISVETID